MWSLCAKKSKCESPCRDEIDTDILDHDNESFAQMIITVDLKCKRFLHIGQGVANKSLIKS